MFRSPESLIVVASHVVAAATLRGGKTPLTVEHQARPADADLGMAVEMALDLLPGSLGRVWLALADVWSQPLTIQADIARRIPADQLPQFVCFEVEPFSGISPSQGLAGVTALPKTAADPSFWVTEIDRGVFDQIENLVRTRGAKLAGLIHPSGLPAPIRPLTSSQSWNRVELWPEITVCLARRGKEIRQHAFLRGPAEDSAPARAWLAEQGPADHHELWNAAGDPRLAESFGEAAAPSDAGDSKAPSASFSIEQPDHLRAWIEGWGRTLGALRRPSELRVPLVRPPHRPMTAREKKFATGLISAAAALLVAGHYQGMGFWNRSAEAALNEPMGKLTAPAAAAKQLRKKLGEQQKELDSLTTKQKDLAAEIERFRSTAASQKRRIPELLEALSEACGPTVLLRQIELDNGRMRVHGRCIDTRQANQVVQVLAHRLSDLGLVVSPPVKEARYQLGDGAPHDFSFYIDDVAAPQGGMQSTATAQP